MGAALPPCLWTTDALLQEGVTSKAMHDVTYPEGLDLRQYCGPSLQQPGKAEYELEGVLLHEGPTMEHGHCHGVHRTAPGVWQHLNDAAVVESSLEYALSFYKDIYVACSR